MGAWVGLNIAKKYPDLIAGIVGLAADPDFTENLLWRFLPEEKKVKQQRCTHVLYPPSPDLHETIGRYLLY